MFKLQGIYAPIATPFAGGKIAYDMLDKNLKFWLKSDLTGIVVMGSNGEFARGESRTDAICLQLYERKEAGNCGDRCRVHNGDHPLE